MTLNTPLTEEELGKLSLEQFFVRLGYHRHKPNPAKRYVFKVGGSSLTKTEAIELREAIMTLARQYGDQREHIGFDAGIDATHEFYATDRLHPITYTKEQYEAYGDQRELQGRIDEVTRSGVQSSDEKIKLYTKQRISELKGKL